MESIAQFDCVPESRHTVRRQWRSWGLGGAACLGLAWLGWLAIRTTVEAEDFRRLADIPVFRNCMGVENVGPVRTRTYRGQNRNGSMWVTGTWPDEEFQKFVMANDLFIEDGGDWGNRFAENLPVEFTGQLDFTPQDTIVAGIIRGCDIGVKGARSKRTGKFVFMFSLKR
jgi:hypothetical protein